MYQALLTRRYLFSKVMPLLASVAVLLCTAMVLVTWSVMGGFLNTLINTGRTLTGDVSVMWDTSGFPHYEELIERLEKDPMVEAAAPMLQAYGMIHFSDIGRSLPVQVQGIDPRYARVTEYANVMWWKPLDKPLPKDTKQRDIRLKNKDAFARFYQDGMALEKFSGTPQAEPALVLGMEVSKYNQREIGGFYSTYESGGKPLLLSGGATLNLLPSDSTGKLIESTTAIFPIANEFQSGLYEADKQVVFAPLASVQKMMHMQEIKPAAPVTGEGEQFGGVNTGNGKGTPAKVTHVLVKGKGTVADARALQKRVQVICDEFAAAHPGDRVLPRLSIMTWREMNGTFIAAVEKETALVLVLFAFMSVVAVFLVLAIFWSMVSEKTKDVGILRALGASRMGVAWIWIRYGLAIGIVGALLGGGVAYLIVHNINPIHEWMGRAFGLSIWDPKIYYFTVIPSKMDGNHAAIVMVSFVLSCAVGAFIPAVRAAWLHPVRALRFE